MAISIKEGRICIYAELLSNIRQVSVAATLPSPPQPGTVARIVDNGRQLRLEHDGRIETLDLPGTVGEVSMLEVTRSASCDLAWRLPLSSVGVQAPHFSPENQAIPWAAMDIDFETPVSCRKCDANIIPAGTIQCWKDLPSENWAEMMEFWHCHKPHDHGQHENDDLANKAYGANSTIASQPGIGFVDITSFMFDEINCQNLLFSLSTVESASSTSSEAVTNSTPGKYLHIFCRQCFTEVGLFSTRVGSVTLFKWQVTCNTVLPTSRTPSGSECLAASLVANISRSGCAKSLISPHVSEKEHGIEKLLYIWALNPNVVYTSSSTQGKRTAMKILFREVTSEEGNKLLDSMVSDVQDLYLPTATIHLSQEQLKSSSRLLPGKERYFKEWQVGLLDKWVAGR